MALELFRHNEEAYKAVVSMLAERNKAAVVHPTGTGKSFIGFKLCYDNSDKIICWLSPSRYIYQTQLENLKEASGGYEPHNVKFYTYAKLMLLSDENFSEIKPDYIILDEFHRCGAEYWGMGVQKLLEMYPDTPLLGLSATAIRYLDNQRDMTDELFDGNIASEMTLGDAIVRGILDSPKYILSIFSYQKDLDEYEKRVKNARYKSMRDKAEEYLEALRRALDKAEKLDDIFDKHMENRAGKYIVFCANREHMDDMIDKADEWFHKVDKRPHIYEAYSNDPETSKAFHEFKEDNTDHLKLLYCIDMLNEGVHVDDVSGVILLRPTISPIIYKQQIGRALSAGKSQRPVIFDIVNNIENLYSIDSIKEEMKVAVRYYRSHDSEGMVVNDNFELIDKVEDCKKLFDKLEEFLSASWDIMYEKAKAYYEKNGDLEIPATYFTEDGYSLGLWINTQRGLYRGTHNGKPLTQMQIDALNAIGMRWQSIGELSWERYYEAAKKYYEENSNLLAPYSYVNENGINIGQWLVTQRMAKKNGIRKWGFSEERSARLDEIGMVWDVPDYLWEENYEAAVRYHRENGDLDVPAKYVDSEGICLGVWLDSMRKSRRTGSRSLTAEQISRLDKLGMSWDDRNNRKWNDMFRELTEYYKDNNNFNIPVSYKTKNGACLDTWVERQRILYRDGKLSDARIEKLKSINFVFDATSSRWEEKYLLLKKYYDEHGNTDISDDLTVSRASINTWISRQKKYAKEGRLSEKQIEKLKAIGLLSDISYHEHIWNERYSLAKQYYEEYGNISVPQNAVYHEFQLGIWIYKQRVQKREGVLSQDRIELLDKLGIEWNNLSEMENASLYEKGFQHLEKFISEKGIYKIRAITVCDDGYRLGNWISNCRVRYRRGELAKKYVERFRKLRFPLDAKDEWEYRYEELKAYFEKNDTKRLPEKYTAYDGTDLSLWVSKQKRAYKKGELTKEQMKKFDDIGYPFKAEKSWIYKANMTKWLAKYEIVKEYLELHKGEKLDPKAEYKGIKIIDWIRQQRNFIQNGVFSDERVEMFNELDPKTVLDNLISHWDIMYEEAVRYFNEHGVGASVKKGIIVDGSELCNWVNGEQKIVNGKDSTSRTPEQIEKLKKIGIERQVNDRFEKQWLTRYEELRSFIAENGRMPLTRKIKGSENSIAVWLNSQKKKYKNGQMSDKHIEMLEALKVDLDPEKICR